MKAIYLHVMLDIGILAAVRVLVVLHLNKENVTTQQNNRIFFFFFCKNRLITPELIALDSSNYFLTNESYNITFI